MSSVERELLLLTCPYLPSHRWLAICLCPFDPISIGARPKNAPLLRNDALPGLPAPRTGHRVFAGQRQCRRRGATAADPRPPTLQAFRVPRAQVGSPAPCDGTRHQLIPSPIQSVLRLRADQPTRDALALASRLSRLGWLGALALKFLSHFLATVVCIAAHRLYLKKKTEHLSFSLYARRHCITYCYDYYFFVLRSGTESQAPKPPDRWRPSTLVLRSAVTHYIYHTHC